MNVLVLGTGEYVTGIVDNQQSQSDKKLGVIGLVLFDLRRRGLVNRIVLAGRNGAKFPIIRQHFIQNIESRYKDMNTEFESFPEDDQVDSKAYITALDTMSPGDLCFIFTPDNLHNTMAEKAIERNLHVLVTKPIVQDLKDNINLFLKSIEKKVLVATEVHKRFDPIYADAHHRILGFGDFSYFYSYMSQPKIQLDTFKKWAGVSSDISYYLNSHHIDFHVWAMIGKAIPISVYAVGSTGVCSGQFDIDTEDTITLTVRWKNLESGNIGTAIYTASWIAPTSDVHSQQRFHYMGTSGEVVIDQAHRGYSTSTDENGYTSVNPLYMKYTPSASGHFAGQSGYGYVSLQTFVEAAQQLNTGKVEDPSYFDDKELATVNEEFLTTAILQAGKKSIESGEVVTIEYTEEGIPQGYRYASM
eukprot:TRINITY_DN3663_c0_g1_i1.p1 TRINITY_DN3663_c0_g1~~TRINITY_DN3663_c0_g1_i1.p1  ORF type:complete len:416 (-),score=92.31 TRINITY_DN3663_c0_g1_i1:26-1273(-)